MRNDITEFSFAYAFTEEFVRSMDYELDFAPYIPNLREEGKVNYDLKVTWGIPIFIQFKLSEYIKVLSSRVREFRDGIYAEPFYRFDLRTYKDELQHNMLVELNNSGEVVSYIAPIFHKLDNFNNFYRNRQIIDNSIIIEPKVIDYCDNERHYISFISQNDFHVFSEPKKFEGNFDFKIFRENILKKLYRNAEQGIRLDEGYWQHLEYVMKSIISSTRYVYNQERLPFNKDAPVIERVNFLSRVYFNTEMFVASMIEN